MAFSHHQERGFPMAKFRYLDIDVAAWIMDTKHLSPCARGVYIDCIILAWTLQHCRIPNDVEKLRELLSYNSKDVVVLKRIIDDFWKTDRTGKWLIQKRLRKEMQAADKRKLAAQDSAKARWHKGKKASRNASTVTGTVLDSPSGYSNTVPSRMRARASLKATRDAPRDEEKINPYPVKGPTAEERAREWADYCAKMKAEEERNAATKH